MSKNNTSKNNARRKLLKGLAAGGGAVIAGKSLPDSWSRPVIDSVMLPAHAQTSITGFVGTNLVVIPSDTRMAGLLGVVVNDAHAESDPEHSVDSVCINMNADGTSVTVDAVMRWLTEDYYDVISVTANNVPIGGVPVTMATTLCPGNNAEIGLMDQLGLVRNANAGYIHDVPVLVQVDSIGGAAIGSFNVDNGNIIEFNLPPGECSAPACPPQPLR